MKILVINSGSSSLKYQLLDMATTEVMCKGLAERIGIEGGVFTHKAKGSEWVVNANMPSHAEAFDTMLQLMTTGEGAVVADKSEIDAIGHRVVHGGEKFKSSVLVTDEVIKTIEELSNLAPLHNPPQVQGILSARKVFGDNVPQAAVFDTAFHQTMPDKAYMYGVPYEFYTENSVRRYGFHGTSHKFVAQQAAELLGKPIEELKIVTCHLGNGSSITAVDGGKSVDTSMGLTPLAGVLMGTRSGDIDPSVVTFISEETGKSANEIDTILNKKSGFLGISGVSSDNRDIEDGMNKGDARCTLTHAMFAYQIKKFIGAYSAAMGGLDAVVFTGGIGENSSQVRHSVCKNMEYIGIIEDAEKNKVRGEMVDFSAPEARVRTLIIPTNEELMIAQDTQELVNA